MEETQADNPDIIFGDSGLNDVDGDNSIDSTSWRKEEIPATVSVHDDDSVQSHHLLNSRNDDNGSHESEKGQLIGSWMIPTAPYPVEIAFVPSGEGDVAPVVVEPKDGSFRGERKLLKVGDLLQDIPFFPPGVDEHAIVVPKDGSYRTERKLPQPLDEGSGEGGSSSPSPSGSIGSLNRCFAVGREGDDGTADAVQQILSHSRASSVDREINFSPGASEMQTAPPPESGSFIEDRSRSPRKGAQPEINVLPETTGKRMPTSSPPNEGSFRGQINHTDIEDDVRLRVENPADKSHWEFPEADSDDNHDIDISDEDPMAEDQDLWKWKKRWDSVRQKQSEKAEAESSSNHDQESIPPSSGDNVLASSIQMLGSLLGSSGQEVDIAQVDSQEEAIGLSQSIQKIGSLLSSMPEGSIGKTDPENSVEDDLLDDLLGDEDIDDQADADKPLVGSIVEGLSAVKELSTGKKISEDDVTTVHMGNTTPRRATQTTVDAMPKSFPNEDSIEESIRRGVPKQTVAKGRNEVDTHKDGKPMSEKQQKKPAVPKFRHKKKMATETVVPVKLPRKPAVPRFRTGSGIDTFMATKTSDGKRNGIGRTMRMMSRFTGWTQRVTERRTESDTNSEQEHGGIQRLDAPKTPDRSRFEIIGRPYARHRPDFYTLSPLATHSHVSLSSHCTVSCFQSPRRDGSKGCQNNFDPYLHPQRGPCELCVFFLSDQERAQLDATGRHVSVMFTTGGCCRSCEIFPRSFDDQPARLCRMCYQNSHRKVHQMYTSKWSRRVTRPLPAKIPELGE
jgi:hypothetical protein